MNIGRYALLIRVYPRQSASKMPLQVSPNITIAGPFHELAVAPPPRARHLAGIRRRAVGAAPGHGVRAAAVRDRPVRAVADARRQEPGAGRAQCADCAIAQDAVAWRRTANGRGRTPRSTNCPRRSAGGANATRPRRRWMQRRPRLRSSRRRRRAERAEGPARTAGRSMSAQLDESKKDLVAATDLNAKSAAQVELLNRQLAAVRDQLGKIVGGTRDLDQEHQGQGQEDRRPRRATQPRAREQGRPAGDATARNSSASCAKRSAIAPTSRSSAIVSSCRPTSCSTRARRI